jgi:ArsR family transcriptional regulator
MSMKPVTLESEDTRLLGVFRALANPVRFRMVQYMVEHPQCITDELAAFADLAQSTTSQHLAVLRDAGLVCGTTEGTARCYCLNVETLDWFRDRVAAWSDQLVSCCTPDCR